MLIRASLGNGRLIYNWATQRGGKWSDKKQDGSGRSEATPGTTHWRKIKLCPPLSKAESQRRLKNVESLQNRFAKSFGPRSRNAYIREHWLSFRLP
jgi:hypothetical protein